MSENVYESPNADLSTGTQEIAILSNKQILFSFNGRIGRQTYWLSYLAIVVVFMVVFGIIGGLMGENPGIIGGLLGITAYIIVIWAFLALSVKRWHDRNKSGWWVLISLVPIIGAIWSLIENGFLRGTDGANNFGPPPF